MNKEDFEKLGFRKDDDPMFQYRKDLVPWDAVEDNDLSADDIPCLLYGNTPMNSGFCVYTGAHFIWLNIKTPKEAIEFVKNIYSFEQV